MVKPDPSGRPYFILNVILTGVILTIMGYSFFYSPDEEKYPVPCVHQAITGEPCPSCGLSHAFSLIVRGRIDEALQWNSQSIRVFLFFVVQFFMRIGLGAWTIVTARGLKQITVADATVSSAMTLVAFYPFMRSLWLTLF
ncbi:DUF2752 domain-containing protein [bacterium]|nr:DUF2752 domain-containing protein [bacterium]